MFRPNVGRGDLHMLYDAYELCYPGKRLQFTLDDFEDLMGRGHLHCGMIVSAEDGDDWGRLEAVFGVQLMLWPRLHLSFLFYCGRFHRRMIEVMFIFLWRALQICKKGQGSDKPGAVRIKGRKGWQAMVRQLGFRITKDGYITENQKAVRNGISKWVSEF